MRWLNYHHLYYFWTVVENGTITAAAKSLRIAQPTISMQLRDFENALDVRLFSKNGRTLELTEAGHLVYDYAKQIFLLGSELLDSVEGRNLKATKPLRIGLVESVPKLIASRLLSTVFESEEHPPVVCIEGSAERLLAELALKELDIILADCPIPHSVPIKAFNHTLGKSSISFVATSALKMKLRKSFPNCLDGAPMYLPTQSATARRELDAWFEKRKVRPKIIGEFQDSALMKMVGRNGNAIFPVPKVVEREVCREFKVQVVGRTKEQIEEFFIISIERRLKHPAVLSIVEEAKSKLLRI